MKYFVDICIAGQKKFFPAWAAQEILPFRCIKGASLVDIMGIRGNKVDTITLPQQFSSSLAFYAKISKQTSGIYLNTQTLMDELFQHLRHLLEHIGSFRMGKDKFLAVVQQRL